MMEIILVLLIWKMVMKIKNIPDQQDIIWINFQPSKGQEIRGRHPAVVLSHADYTIQTGLVAVSPITHA